MKYPLIFGSIIAFSCVNSLQAAPGNFPDGIIFGSSDYFMGPQTLLSLQALVVSSETGATWIYSGIDDSDAGGFAEGGVNIQGDPVRLFLGTNGGTDEGVFQVWPLDKLNSGLPTLPVFEIDSSADTAVFNGLDVKVDNGSLSTGKIRVTAPTVPSSASASGTAGDIAWDANFIYVCTATNTWKRVAISTW